MRLALIVLTLALAPACSEQKDIADRVEDRAASRANAMEAAADSMTNALQQNRIEQQAETVRDAGKERAEAIRSSGVDDGSLSEADKAKLIRGDVGTPAPATR